MLDARDVAKFHRLKSDETWHFYTGSSLTIHIINPKGKYSTARLGAEPGKQQVFQCVIKKNHWFGATVDNTKSFSLVGCTVAPGFDFADFEMAQKEKLFRLCPGRRSIIEQLT
jgi:predicted cupin superfamily sugar epimerase